MELQAGVGIHYKNARGECQQAAVTRVVDEKNRVVDLLIDQPSEHQHPEHLSRIGVAEGTGPKTWHEPDADRVPAPPAEEEVSDGEA